MDITEIILAQHDQQGSGSLERKATPKTTELAPFQDSEIRRVEPPAPPRASQPQPHAGLVYATLIPNPSKVLCIGLNYRNHIAEVQMEEPKYPTIFAKFASSLTGANDSVEIPGEDHRVDYEGELAVIIGAPGRDRVSRSIITPMPGVAIRACSLTTKLFHAASMGRGSAVTITVSSTSVTMPKMVPSGTTYTSASTGSDPSQDR